MKQVGMIRRRFITQPTAVVLLFTTISIIFSLNVNTSTSSNIRHSSSSRKRSELNQQNHRRHLLQDISDIPSPYAEEEHPLVAYPLKTEGALNWYSANYIPKKNGGKSLVPMEDGLDIAKKGSSKIHEGDGYNVEPIEAPMAERKDQTFKVGTDKEYMAMRNNGNQAPAKPAEEGEQGDMSKDASLLNDGHEIDPPGVNGAK